MGMRRYRSYYAGNTARKYTQDMAEFEMGIAVLAGLLLVPFTFGLSLLVIPFVALKAAVCLPRPTNKRRPPSSRR